MKTNTKPAAVHTHAGARACRITPALELRRAVMACMLWEDQFYESGKDIATRICELIPKVDAAECAQIASEARNKMKLRHVPLLVAREMARLASHKCHVGTLLADIIQRPDEITEFLSIYWKDKRQPVSAQVKKGLARAFRKFNEYQFAKYDRDGKVKLRDALFLSHARPEGAQGITKHQRGLSQCLTDPVALPKLSDGEELFRKIVAGELQTPDTWEVALSAGADKKETFERLMRDNKLGGLAFLRNLRNMKEAGVDTSLVKDYAANLKTERILPFRFLAAARMVPAWEHYIESAMLRCMEGQTKLPGSTIVLVDVSGSMEECISAKSDLKRLDAAYGVAILLREIAEDGAILTFSEAIREIPPRRGFALRDAMHGSQPHGGTYLGKAVTALNSEKYDRIIVITDEQTADSVPAPTGKGYIINVASYKHGVGYGSWTHIDGFSESVVDYVREFEAVETTMK